MATPTLHSLTLNVAFQGVSIGGEAVRIAEGSLAIDEAIEERSTASFVVLDLPGETHYRKGQPVEIQDPDGVLVFAGVIDSVTEREITPSGELAHTVRCADWHYLADKRIAANSYEEMTAGDIVRDLVDTILTNEGVTYTVQSVQDGPIIEQAVINYAPVSEALDKLAEVANFTWYIDPAKVLHFADRSTVVAPFTATGADMRRDSVSVEHGNPKYRNRQYVKGGRALTDPQTETREGDGETQSFAIGFPLGREPTVEVDRGTGFVEETVGIKGVETGTQWFWSKGDPVLTQEIQDTPLVAGDMLRVTYQGEFDIVALTEDPAAIIDRQTVEGSGTGFVEDVADEPNASTREAAFEFANAKLARFAVIGRTLKFRTRRAGLKPGQLLTVDLPDHGIDNVEMLVESVAVSDQETLLWHDVTALEGPQLGSWVRLFAALAQRGQAFVERINIGEEQILVILKQFSKTWIATDTPNIFTEVFPSDTLFPAEDLFPMFDPLDRITHLEWEDAAGTPFGRKIMTTRDGLDTSEIHTVVYLAPFEANTTIEDLVWYGGFRAMGAVGSGVEVARELVADEKTSLEAWQISRTDSKGF